MIFDFGDDAEQLAGQQLDPTNITSMLVYFSEQDMKLFKSLCKTGMLAMYGDGRFKANVSDFLLDLLKQQYADPNAK